MMQSKTNSKSLSIIASRLMCPIPRRRRILTNLPSSLLRSMTACLLLAVGLPLSPSAQRDNYTTTSPRGGGGLYGYAPTTTTAPDERSVTSDESAEEGAELSRKRPRGKGATATTTKGQGQHSCNSNHHKDSSSSSKSKKVTAGTGTSSSGGGGGGGVAVVAASKNNTKTKLYGGGGVLKRPKSSEFRGECDRQTDREVFLLPLNHSFMHSFKDRSSSS